MKRGDVFLIDLIPRSGSEQTGKRPAIIVSHDVFNQSNSWRSVVVVPISTSPSQARRGPTAILLPKGSGGLTSESTALCHQVTTLDRSKCVRYLGTLSQELLTSVETGLKAALDLS